MLNAARDQKKKKSLLTNKVCASHFCPGITHEKCTGWHWSIKMCFLVLNPTNSTTLLSCFLAYTLSLLPVLLCLLTFDLTGKGHNGSKITLPASCLQTEINPRLSNTFSFLFTHLLPFPVEGSTAVWPHSHCLLMNLCVQPHEEMIWHFSSLKYIYSWKTRLFFFCLNTEMCIIGYVGGTE